MTGSFSICDTVKTLRKYQENDDTLMNKRSDFKLSHGLTNNFATIKK